jgi:hypothetical protein
METTIFFPISHKYDQTINEKLKELATIKIWDKGKQKYIYFYNIQHLETIRSLIGNITFKQEEITKIIKYIKEITQEIPADQWKGKSGYKVIETPNNYKVIEHQKNYKGQTPRRQEHDVPKERLKQLWNNVILKLEKNTPYRFENLARKVCKEFELHRFFRPTTNSFDKQKFQGSRGEGYFQYYHYPLTVLINLELIKRNGQNITRIKDKWETQSIFNE